MVSSRSGRLPRRSASGYNTRPQPQERKSHPAKTFKPPKLENQNPSKPNLPPRKPPRPKPTITLAWSQHGKSQLTEPKVATRKKIQALKGKSKKALQRRRHHPKISSVQRLVYTKQEKEAQAASIRKKKNGFSQFLLLLKKNPFSLVTLSCIFNRASPI